jgi:hypothetical protein
MFAATRAIVFGVGLAVTICASLAAQNVAPTGPASRAGDKIGSASARPSVDSSVATVKHQADLSGGDTASDPGLYLKMQLNNPVRVKALRPGDAIEGKLSQDVYSGDQELFSAGSRAELIVDKLETRRRTPNDHWPWMIKFFGPRHERYPTFQSASVFAANGTKIPLRVSLISMGREREVQARAKKSKSPVASGSQASAASAANSKPGESAKNASGPVATLEAAMLAQEKKPTVAALPGPVTLAAGTQAKVVLLGGISASKNRAGDSFQARVVEPVRLDSKVVLPEGTLVEGKVVKSTAPRVLSRSGSLLLTFTELTLPGGAGIPVAASITAAGLDLRSQTAIDPEGVLHGERPGKVWMLLNAGVTAGIAKEVDDGTQLVIEAIVSTATNASTAGTAKIVATCASGIFMLTRHGRDVVLPKFTQMNIIFDRPVSLGGPQAPARQ